MTHVNEADRQNTNCPQLVKVEYLPNQIVACLYFNTEAKEHLPELLFVHQIVIKISILSEQG